MSTPPCAQFGGQAAVSQSSPAEESSDNVSRRNESLQREIVAEGIPHAPPQSSHSLTQSDDRSPEGEVSYHAAPLDATRFPHLFDAILDFAPPDSLRALRAASRWARQRVTPRLPLELIFSSTHEGATCTDVWYRFAWPRSLPAPEGALLSALLAQVEIVSIHSPRNKGPSWGFGKPFPGHHYRYYDLDAAEWPKDLEGIGLTRSRVESQWAQHCALFGDSHGTQLWLDGDPRDMASLAAMLSVYSELRRTRTVRILPPILEVSVAAPVAREWIVFTALLPVQPHHHDLPMCIRPECPIPGMSLEVERLVLHVRVYDEPVAFHAGMHWPATPPGAPTPRDEHGNLPALTAAHWGCSAGLLQRLHHYLHDPKSLDHGYLREVVIHLEHHRGGIEQFVADGYAVEDRHNERAKRRSVHQLDWDPLPDRPLVLAGALSRLVMCMAFSLPRIRYTIIGLKDLASIPYAVGLEPNDPALATPHSHLLGAIGREMSERHDKLPAEIDVALKAVTFMEPEAYRRAVGEHRYLLETRK